MPSIVAGLLDREVHVAHLRVRVVPRVLVLLDRDRGEVLLGVRRGSSCRRPSPRRRGAGRRRPCPAARRGARSSRAPCRRACRPSCPRRRASSRSRPRCRSRRGRTAASGSTERTAWPPEAQAFSTDSMGLRLEAGHLGHEAGEEALLVERDVAGGADRGRRRGPTASIPISRAGAGDRVRHDLGHGHAHELAEHRLVVGGDVDGLHDGLPRNASTSIDLTPTFRRRRRRPRRGSGR